MALDRGLTRAATQQELWLARFTGAAPEAGELPLDSKVVTLAQQAASQGRPLYLLAENPHLARALLERAQLDACVIDLNGLRGDSRLKSLRRLIGDDAFEFAGAAPLDQPIRRAAGVDDPVTRLLRVDTVLGLWRSLRPHHWIKNLLIFLPLLAAQKWQESSALAQASAAFGVFCLTCSAIYIVNDLFDLRDDRRHPHKRYRPLAAGQLKPATALLAALLLLGTGIALAGLWIPSGHFLALTLTYAVVALLYSRWLKTLRFIDLFSLGALYTLRVAAGAAAIHIWPSFWLLALCLCLFTSLACAKRAAELVQAQKNGLQGISRRRYQLQDLKAIRALGALTATGACAVLIIYTSEKAPKLYANPYAVGLAALPLMLWVVHIWQKATAGQIREDPVLFALRDAKSWLLLAVLLLMFVLAQP